MISMDKKYQTRGGREVRIYATDAGGQYPIHGAVKLSCGSWLNERWSQAGTYYHQFSGTTHSMDLIEVKPRYRIERWVNVYSGDCGTLWETRETAMRNREVGCIDTRRIVIESEEGQDE